MARVLVVTPPSNGQEEHGVAAPAEDDCPTFTPPAWRDAQLIANRLQALIRLHAAPALYAADVGRDALAMSVIADTFEACPTYLSDLRATGTSARKPAALTDLSPSLLAQPRYGRRISRWGPYRDANHQPESEEARAAKRERVEGAYRAMTTIEADPAPDRIVSPVKSLIVV